MTISAKIKLLVLTKVDLWCHELETAKYSKLTKCHKPAGTFFSIIYLRKLGKNFIVFDIFTYSITYNFSTKTAFNKFAAILHIFWFC